MTMIIKSRETILYKNVSVKILGCIRISVGGSIPVHQRTLIFVFPKNLWHGCLGERRELC